MNTQEYDGRSLVERPGFSYLPRFIEAPEAEELIRYFSSIRPIWESRYRDARPTDSSQSTIDRVANKSSDRRRLTRPVYWLGAWQFACLGYYAEPNYRDDRCVEAEPFPQVMQDILTRLLPTLTVHDPTFCGTPNTCLINYYGREVGDGPPRDYARLRMHRDGEPGPVVMFSIGQPGRLEFLDPGRSKTPELAVWTRHRSVSVLSGPEFKDRLYHRVTQVRYGQEPEIRCRVPGFETRRISVSFRHVPEDLITPFAGLNVEARASVREYVVQLAQHSAHFRAALRAQ